MFFSFKGKLFQGIVIIIVLFFAYRYFAIPFFESTKTYQTDQNLQKHLDIIYSCEKFYPNGLIKVKEYVRKFFVCYSESFLVSSKLSKLKLYKDKCMKYIYNIKHRLHNDSKLDHKYDTATENINNILENYIYAAYNRNNQFYFPSK